MICLHEDITFRKWHVTTFSSELLCFEGKKQKAERPGRLQTTQGEDVVFAV